MRFRKYLEAFFDLRIEDISIKAQSGKYLDLVEEQIQLTNEMFKQLDKEGQSAFVEYEDKVNKGEIIIRDKLYKTGFFDGWKACKILFGRRFESEEYERI